LARIKYDINLIKYISLFESITQVKVKDCISNGRLTFIVHEGDLGKAVGKKGANAKMLENVIRKRIRMVEFSSEVTEFIKNLIYPINAREIAEKNGIDIPEQPPYTRTAQSSSGAGQRGKSGRESHNSDTVKRSQ